jgi:DNA polymerase III subunit chi
VSAAEAPSGPELWFYHLERSDLEDMLALLLEKSLQRGWRALVVSPSQERLDLLDEALWTKRPEGFLPHGRADKPKAERQPILLSATAETNPNQASVLFLLDQAWHELLDRPASIGFSRVAVIFDGADTDGLAAARGRWAAAKKAGWQSAYLRETGPGRWEKQG